MRGMSARASTAVQSGTNRPAGVAIRGVPMVRFACREFSGTARQSAEAVPHARVALRRARIAVRDLPMRRTSPSRCALPFAVAALLFAPSVWASFLSGDALDTMADWIAIFVIIVVPIGAIVLFWLVHILPEKVAEKRHHPQLPAITCLCLLSLVFGGLLWPIAWLWAYSKPVLHKMAYGTDVAEPHGHAGEKAAKEENELEQLRSRVAELEAEIKRGKA